VEQQLEFKAIKGVIRRRRKIFLIIFVGICLAAAILAVVLPPIYRSEATIRIEGQQIPEEYVRSTITGYVEERIEMITRQVMSRSKLLEIINQFDLFADIREKYTATELIGKMSKKIHLETISADIIDKRTGRPSAATVAFTLSYEGKNPEAVQKVTEKLTSLYLEEDRRSRKQLVSVTTAFLQEELQSQKAQVIILENKISEFKKDHFGELPEYNAINFQNWSKLEHELDQAAMRIQSLQERKIYLEGQLAGTDPYSPIMTAKGEIVMHPKKRLKHLKMKLISLQSILSEKHPDIRQLKREITDLEGQIGTSDNYEEKIRKLNSIDKQLASVKGRLGSKHPDLLKLKKMKKVLSKEIEELPAFSTYNDINDGTADNPAYINLRIQLASTDLEIKNLNLESNKIEEEIEYYLKKMKYGPIVEKEYNDLTRDYESARSKYNEIMNKLMEAKISEGMEETQRGERFTITDPAYLPEKPYKPNRIAIVLLGFVLAFGASTLFAAGKEYMDNSVKSADELHSLTGVPVFSVISYVESDHEKRTRRLTKGIYILATLAVIGGALMIVNTYLEPLDSLWPKIQHKIDMIRLSF